MSTRSLFDQMLIAESSTVDSNVITVTLPTPGANEFIVIYDVYATNTTSTSNDKIEALEGSVVIANDTSISDTDPVLVTRADAVATPFWAFGKLATAVSVKLTGTRLTVGTLRVCYARIDATGRGV